jgi:hypothetical protein
LQNAFFNFVVNIDKNFENWDISATDRTESHQSNKKAISGLTTNSGDCPSFVSKDEISRDLAGTAEQLRRSLACTNIIENMIGRSVASAAT